MTDCQKKRDSVDGWSLCLVGLWTLFFILGIFPESVFMYFRNLGAVAGQYALVNSPWAITIGWVAFMAIFVYTHCREAGHDENGSTARAVETGLIALVAFLPMELQLLPGYLEIPYQNLKYLLLGAITAKLLCALYLFLMMLAYSLWWGLGVFENMRTVFPSGKSLDRPDHSNEKKATSEASGISAAGEDSCFPGETK
ncbi:MAG TPA: hypothetical protein PLO53_08060 [Candidatus Hydrogenedentes bacterium]|nr:hypothetical protein [Candidatus Hydrogenedentota bacterium]